MAAVMPLDDGDEIPTVGAALPDAGRPLSMPPAMGDLAMTSPGGDVPITLAFEDLLPDENGEIVVMGADLGTQLSIVTDQRVCAAGVAESHVTADGLEVAGLAFYAFESGTRLYYSPEIEVTIAPLHASAA
jgi:hypothetical protein